MQSSHHRARSQLFLVRVWMPNDCRESSGEDCHGKVQRVVSGETRLFSDWQSLVDTLHAMLLPGRITTQLPAGAEGVPEEEQRTKGADNES